MSNCHLIISDAILVRCPGKCLIPGISSRFFLRQLLFLCKLRHINMVTVTWYSKLLTILCHIRFICICLCSADHMINMDSIQLELHFLPKPCQNRQQTDGIRSAGHTNDADISCFKQIFFFYKLINLFF